MEKTTGMLLDLESEPLLDLEMETLLEKTTGMLLELEWEK